jgi:hypothetical protein
LAKVELRLNGPVAWKAAIRGDAKIKILQRREPLSKNGSVRLQSGLMTTAQDGRYKPAKKMPHGPRRPGLEREQLLPGRKDA